MKKSEAIQNINNSIEYDMTLLQRRVRSLQSRVPNAPINVDFKMLNDLRFTLKLIVSDAKEAIEAIEKIQSDQNTILTIESLEAK